MTLIELAIVMAIVAILAAAVFPMARMTARRTREIELRRNLRVLHTAIDRYKELYDQGKLEQKVGASGYPPSLEILAGGVELKSEAGKKVKLLRRVPKDPMTADGEWGLRSNADAPDSTSWGSEDVFRVYSKSDERAIDGTKYSDW
jgi:general secretion pathway protein G